MRYWRSQQWKIRYEYPKVGKDEIQDVNANQQFCCGNRKRFAVIFKWSLKNRPENCCHGKTLCLAKRNDKE